MGRFESFSPKQLAVLGWWLPASPYSSMDGVICDGAVRSGKTLCMSVSFVMWASSSFRGKNFGLCGKTITSLRRNVVYGLIEIMSGLGFNCEYKPSKNYIDISQRGRSNRFYLFGGTNEASASLVQGITLAGVMFDEVALMPRSFVEQALARCSVEGSRYWFSCNPEHPFHWFYREWIQKKEEKNVLYLHFTMEDNPSLSPRIRERYKQLYSGSFYERFVLGRWVAPSGLVYPSFNAAENVCENIPQQFSRFYISCDYGTVNPSSMGLWGYSGGVWYRIKEYYHCSRTTGIQRTDEEHYLELERLAQNRAVKGIIVDPSAASFMETIRRHGRYRVIPAVNQVQSGIQAVTQALRQNKIKLSSNCTDAIREFGMYCWDQRAHSDTPLKENDHAMDDIRYFVMAVVSSQNQCGFYALSTWRDI